MIDFLTQPEVYSVIAVFIVILVGSFMQRISGMGLGLVGGPVLSLLLGPIAGIMVINVLAIINAGLTTISVRKDVDRTQFALISSVLILGAIPGALLILVVSVAWLQVIVGVLLLLALLVVILAQNYIPPIAGKAPALLAGMVGGFMNTLAGLAGPAITVYAQASRWNQRTYAATLQPIFFVAGCLSITVKILFGSGSLLGIYPGIFIAGIAAMFIGIHLGTRATKLIAQTQARKLALLLALLGGVSVLIRGVMAV